MNERWSWTWILKIIMTCVIHTVRFLYTKTAAFTAPIFRFATAKPTTLTIPPTTTTTTTTTTKTLKLKTKNLTKQQENFLKAITNGQSLFLTGSAGTGKSFILIEAIKLLKRIHSPDSVFVTASTGVAACALSGQTLHSFSGIGLGEGDKDFLLRKVAKNKQASKRWKKAKALVIDEISMISCELFENLEYIARIIRGGGKAPWGGIQLIVSGDFFQLPPIIKDSMTDKEFAFEAKCWITSFDLQLELTEVFRQVDENLVALLQGIRKGVWEEEQIKLLNQCAKNPKQSLVTVPRLYPRNQDVKRVNEGTLASLAGEKLKFRAVDSGQEPFKTQLKQGIAPDELEICVGARVMLIRNKDVESGLVNGSTGTVTGFAEGRQGRGLLPKVRFDSGVEMVVEPEK